MNFNLRLYFQCFVLLKADSVIWHKNEHNKFLQLTSEMLKGVWNLIFINHLWDSNTQFEMFPENNKIKTYLSFLVVVSVKFRIPTPVIIHFGIVCFQSAREYKFPITHSNRVYNTNHGEKQQICFCFPKNFLLMSTSFVM